MFRIYWGLQNKLMTILLIQFASTTHSLCLVCTNDSYNHNRYIDIHILFYIHEFCLWKRERKRREESVWECVYVCVRTHKGQRTTCSSQILTSVVWTHTDQTWVLILGTESHYLLSYLFGTHILLQKIK